MKTSMKLAATLAVFAAGSAFCGSLPAQAAGIESEGAKVMVSRHHDAPPPPPPEMHRHHWHRPPPEMRRHHGHRPPPLPHR